MRAVRWRYPRAVWVISMAFTAQLLPRRRGRGTAWWVYPLALLLWPAYFVNLLPFVLIGRVYLSDDGDVALTLRRSDGGADSLWLGVGMTITVAVYFVAFVLLGAPALLYVAATTVMLGLQAREALGDLLDLTIRPPEAPYWTVEGLARMPASATPALRLAGELIERVVPEGELVVAVAGNQRLARVYERYGFVRRRARGLALTARR